MLNEFVTMFLNDMEANNKSQQSIRAYKNDLRKLNEYLTSEYPEITINEVALFHLNKFKIKLVDSKLKESTINRNIRCISSFFSFLFDNEIIESNPTVRFKNVKEVKEEKAYLKPDKIEEVKAATTNKDGYGRCKDFLSVRNEAIISMLGQLGLRSGELRQLELSDVNIKTGECWIFGKGKKYRKVYLNDKNLKMLNEYLIAREDHLNKINIKSDNVFISYRGSELSQKDLYLLVKKMANDCKLENASEITPHSLRHSMASNLIASGENITVVSKILGHSSVSTTLNIYTHVNDSEIESAMKNSDL